MHRGRHGLGNTNEASVYQVGIAVTSEERPHTPTRCNHVDMTRCERRSHCANADRIPCLLQHDSPAIDLRHKRRTHDDSAQ